MHFDLPDIVKRPESARARTCAGGYIAPQVTLGPLSSRPSSRASSIRPLDSASGLLRRRALPTPALNQAVEFEEEAKRAFAAEQRELRKIAVQASKHLLQHKKRRAAATFRKESDGRTHRPSTQRGAMPDVESASKSALFSVLDELDV